MRYYLYMVNFMEPTCLYWGLVAPNTDLMYIFLYQLYKNPLAISGKVAN